MPTADATDQDALEGRPTRRCGRCRKLFPVGDDPGASLDDWWACPDCHVHLFPQRNAFPRSS